MKPLIFSLLTYALFSSSAYASTPEAWTEYYQERDRACLAASNFDDARVLGEAAEYDDRITFAARLIVGRYPQNNQKGTKLCLYDRKNKVAYVTEWTPPAIP